MNKRIAISVPQQPLQSPFLALSSEGLPEGTADPAPSVEKGKPRIILRREKSRRGGKTVIIVSQLPSDLAPPEIERLARDARRRLASGGFSAEPGN
jgi:translation initiation factor 1